MKVYNDFNTLFDINIKQEQAYTDTEPNDNGYPPKNFVVAKQTEALYISAMLINSGVPLIVTVGVQMVETGGLLVYTSVSPLREMNIGLFVCVYLGMCFYIVVLGDTCTV